MGKTGIEYYYLKSKTSKKPTKVFVKVPKEKLLRVGKIYKVRNGWLEFYHGAMCLKNHTVASRTHPLKVFIDGKVVDKYTVWSSVNETRDAWESDNEIWNREDHVKARKQMGMHKLHLE